MDITNYNINISFILLIICANLYFAQNNPGTRQSALVHSDIALSNDVFSLFNNPSGLDLSTKTEFALSYSPAPFEIKELATGYLAFKKSFSFGSFGLGIMNYGFDLYKENKFALGFASNISRKVFLGIATNYQIIKIKNYGNTGIYNITLGGLFLINKKLSLGFSLLNPLRLKINKISSPVIYSFGITYKVHNESSINISVINEIQYPISFRFGVEYYIIKNLILRIGIQNQPNLFAGGIGLVYSFINIDYSSSWHQELGLTHQFGLRLLF